MISSKEKLSTEDQIQLHRLWKEKSDVSARNKLALSYYYWCFSAMKSLDISEDMFQTCFCGLLNAIDLWDPKKGSLASHSWSHMIQPGLRELDKDRCEGLVGGAPLDISHVDVINLWGIWKKEDNPIIPDVVYEDEFNTQSIFKISEHFLSNALDSLSERERSVIDLRLQEISAKEIGLVHSISRQQVAEVEKSALANLRQFFGLPKEGACSITQASKLPKSVWGPIGYHDQRNQTSEDVVSWLSDNPNSTIFDISKSCQLNRMRTQTLMRKLKSEGKVISTETSGVKRGGIKLRYQVANEALKK